MVISGRMLGSGGWRCWGARPGRCFIADGFILFLGMGVYFDSIASQWATGLLRLMVDFVCFSGGGRWRRGGRFQKEHEETRGNVVIFFFFEGSSCSLD
jgi:hypothetical protein